MVTLVPMTEAEFRRYMESAVAEYADAHIRAGDCDPAEALTLAQADYDTLLSEGVQTPGQHLFSVFAAGEAAPVGMIWFELREQRGRKSAFIFDIRIEERHRGKGYGAQTLRQVEEMAAAMGAWRISLNVMGWNRVARALYENAGFQVTGIGMTKRLSEP